MDYILDILNNISEYSTIWIPLIVIYGFIRIYKYKEEQESNLILKMIGFYILGSFSFNLNGFTWFPIVIPIGFITYTYTMRDNERSNKILKHKCAVLGISILALGFVNGFIYNELEYRSYTIKDYSADVGNLYEDWEGIENRLKLQGQPLLTEFRMTYDKDDKIENLYFVFTDPSQMDRTYIANSSLEGKLYIDTIKNESDYMLGFDMYNNDYFQTDIDEFMKILSNIEFAKSPLEEGKDILAYDIIYEAHNSSTSWTNEYNEGFTYIINSVENNYEDIGYRKAKFRELPLKGIIINHLPMEKVEENISASTNTDSYVLYAYTNELLIKEDTESLLVENIKENKSIEYNNYDYKINEIAETLEFYKWEETESKNVENIPYITLTDNNGTIITLYENNYATYENKEERIVYKIPEVTIDNVLVIFDEEDIEN